MAHVHIDEPEHRHSHGRRRTHGHGHGHGHIDSSGRNLLLATILNVIITVFEFAGGILSNSYALLSDAFHNLGDAVAVFIAYISNKVSKKPPTISSTFGFKRIEILAAFINGAAMVAICVYLFIEAYERLINPEPINGLLMIVVASIGLIANLLAVSFLSQDKDRNLNVKAAYIHLLGDTLSSIAVVLGGIFIYFYQIWWLDPLLTFIIGVYILKETYVILRQAYNILMQATPPEIDINEVKSMLESMEEIDNIHHVHVWKLTDFQIHFECHVDLNIDYKISETEPILTKMKAALKEKFAIEHTTIQLEFNCCDNKATINKLF